jgi:preprotein translocase subunit SecA
MTGTGAEAAAEFWQIYHKPVVVIPTHRPCLRTVEPDRVFTSESAKWEAVVDEIRRTHQTGRPILVGTRSVKASEHLSNRLTSVDLEHRVLNAVRHREEAEIVAKAGERGRITVATNMAGRGTDIRLGKSVADLGGLYVIATERHEARRIDRQLYGRCGRQGDPGGSRSFISFGDELMQLNARLVSAMLMRCYRHFDREIFWPFCRWLVNRAQRRCERSARRQRKAVLRTDRWIKEYLGFAGKDL